MVFAPKQNEMSRPCRVVIFVGFVGQSIINADVIREKSKRSRDSGTLQHRLELSSRN